MEAFLPSFGGVAFTVFAFILALSVIVAIHEYGHYIVGRWSGIGAEVFSIGFGPVLWSRTDRRGTKWQVAALPFGGYVKFLGDANAASVGAAEGVEPARNTMLGAPLWARSATVAAGPVFNFALSFLIFALIIGFRGEVAEPMTVSGIPDLPEPYVQEILPGDQILAIAGRAVSDAESLGDALEDLPEERVLDYTLLRDGQRLSVSGPYPFLPLAAGIVPRSAADDIGLRPGDLILSANGQDIFTFDQLVEIVTSGGGVPITLEIWRAGALLDFALVPRRADEPQPEGGFETNWRIGIQGNMLLELETERLGPLEAIQYGAIQVWTIITSSLSGLWHIVSGAISTCNLSGPVGIAETSGSMASQGLIDFIWFIAVLSTAVGLLNLFPVPVLDGGHLVFHVWEAVTGHPPSDGALRILIGVGLSLILGLMVFAIANDLFLCP